MTEIDLTVIVLAVASLAMSIVAIVLTFTKKPDTDLALDIENINSKITKLNDRMNALEGLTKGELKMTLHEMAGRIDQLNKAVFK